MVTWDPKLHPRLPGGPGGGEFTHTVGGWLESLSDASGSAVGDGPRWARAKDRVRPKMRVPSEKILQYEDDSGDGPDGMLGEIYRMQGYDTKPEVLSPDEMDRRVAAGWTEVFRGFGALPEARSHIQDMKTGDRHYPGLGIRGNGTYTTTEFQEAQEYTDQPPEADLNVDDMSDDELYAHDTRLATDQTLWPGIARMALSPHARVAEYNPNGSFATRGALYDEFYTDRMAAWEANPDDGHVLADIGRYAALRGYDAIRIPGGLGQRNADHYIVFNRGALAVQR